MDSYITNTDLHYDSKSPTTLHKDFCYIQVQLVRVYFRILCHWHLNHNIFTKDLSRIIEDYYIGEPFNY